MKKIIRSEFFRNTFTLISGTFIAQLIPILIQPILRRFYSEETFGAYAVYTSLVGIIYYVSSLRYEQAIIVAKSKEEASNVLVLSQIMNFIIGISLLTIMLIFKHSILKLLNIRSQYQLFIILVPVGAFLFNLFVSFNLWLTRYKAFSTISKVKIVRRGVEGMFQLIFRFIRLAKGLVLGDLIGHIINNSYAIYKSVSYGFDYRQIKVRHILGALREYSEFPKFNLVTGFMSACGTMLPAIIITRYFGAINTGFYDLSRIVLLTPIALIASSISNVLLQRVAEKKQQRSSFKNDLFYIVIIGILISVVEIVIIFIGGQKLFAVVFGKNWAYSGQISKVLIWPYITYFFTFSLNSVFLALREIKKLSLYQFINFLLIISLFFIHIPSFSTFLHVFLIISIVSGSVFFLLLMKIVRKYESKLKYSL